MNLTDADRLQQRRSSRDVGERFPAPARGAERPTPSVAVAMLDDDRPERRVG